MPIRAVMKSFVESAPAIRVAAASPSMSLGDVRHAASRTAVLIVNYNGGTWLGDALDALARQTVSGFEVIVVDNGSTDGSDDAVRARHPEVRLIHAGRNLGYAAGNNLAARFAAGARFLALLNPDAVPEPDWLEAILDAALRHPDSGSIASRTINASDGSLLDGAGDVYHASGLAWRRGHRERSADNYRAEEEVFSACGAAALIRREAWDAVRGMDESFFCYMEDVDLGFRLRLAGYTCWYCPAAVARHVCSASTGRQSDFAVFHGQRNMVWVFIKNMPDVLLWALLPAHLALNLAAVLVLARRGQGRIAWRAKREALSGLADVLRKRRAVQALRPVRPARVWRALRFGLPLRR